MAKGIHKGTELNNVQETWNENEKRRGAGAIKENVSLNNLDETIREEADSYDRQHKEDQLLGGDRASVDDEETK